MIEENWRKVKKLNPACAGDVVAGQQRKRIVSKSRDEENWIAERRFLVGKIQPSGIHWNRQYVLQMGLRISSRKVPGLL